MTTFQSIILVFVIIYFYKSTSKKILENRIKTKILKAENHFKESLRYNKENNPEKEVFHLTCAINIYPRFEFYLHRGICYKVINENEKAIEDFSNALLEKPNDKMCLFSRGLCYYNENKKELAFKDLKIAAQLGLEAAKNAIQKYYEDFKIYESPNEILKRKWIENKINEISNFNSLLYLLDSTIIENIKYYDLLNCFEWQFMRFKIHCRDKFKCVDCKELSEKLHIHHTYYLKDALPWEIDESGLVSLCKKCHRKRHDEEIIKVYQKDGERIYESNYFYSVCPRCNGTGYLPHFKHVENGICFLCFGNVIPKTIFSNRLKQVNDNRFLYNENLNELIEFTENISLVYFEEYILNKIYFDDLECEDLPF